MMIKYENKIRFFINYVTRTIELKDLEFINDWKS